MTVKGFSIIYLFTVFLMVALTDYFDGKLARRYNISSDKGARFDVICDFIFIILATLSTVYVNLTPVWFLLIICLKLFEFFKTSGQSLHYEDFGHIVALMFYAYPIVSLLMNSKIISLILCIFITVCALTSSVLRIKSMWIK